MGTVGLMLLLEKKKQFPRDKNRRSYSTLSLAKEIFNAGGVTAIHKALNGYLC